MRKIDFPFVARSTLAVLTGVCAIYTGVEMFKWHNAEPLAIVRPVGRPPAGSHPWPTESDVGSAPNTEALCTTDSECMELCDEASLNLPPDHPDYCDGGPEPASEWPPKIPEAWRERRLNIQN